MNGDHSPGVHWQDKFHEALRENTKLKRELAEARKKLPVQAYLERTFGKEAACAAEVEYRIQEIRREALLEVQTKWSTLSFAYSGNVESFEAWLWAQTDEQGGGE